MKALWDSNPEDSETKHFRQIIDSFMVKKSITARRALATRSWDEGCEPRKQGEGTGPHVLLQCIHASNEFKRKSAIERRREEERRQRRIEKPRLPGLKKK